MFLAVFVLAFILLMVYRSLSLQQQENSSRQQRSAVKAKPPLSRAKFFKSRRQKLKHSQPPKATVFAGVTKLPAFLKGAPFHEVEWLKVEESQEGKAKVVSGVFEVKANQYELENSLIDRFSREWTLIRESSTTGLGFNLIFQQLSEGKTLAFFASKREVGINKKLKSLMQVTFFYAVAAS